MPRYAACFSKTGADSVRQLVELQAGGAFPQRPMIVFVSVGCVTTPADAVFTYVVRRVTLTTTAGGALKDSIPIDPTDSGNYRIVMEHLITGDNPSFAAGAEVLRVPCHHRSVCIFAAADGQELVGAQTDGISLGLADVSTSQFEGTIIYKG